MTASNFVVKNGLVVNGAFTANSTVVNAISYTIGTSFTANTTNVNAASYSIGTYFAANTIGVNAASYTIGTSFTANSTIVNAQSFSSYTNTNSFGTAVYVSPGGNVGIGTSTPGFKLDIVGGIKVNSSGVSFNNNKAQLNVGMVWYGAYSASTSYPYGAVVYYTDGSNYGLFYYINATTLSGNPPSISSATSYWQPMFIVTTPSPYTPPASPPEGIGG
jgi:hypothetical protein